jgi:hypothetical protein
MLEELELIILQYAGGSHNKQYLEVIQELDQVQRHCMLNPFYIMTIFQRVNPALHIITWFHLKSGWNKIVGVRDDHELVVYMHRPALRVMLPVYLELI